MSYFTLAAFSGRAAAPRPREGLSVDPDQVVDALREAFVREFGDPGRLPQRAILFEAIRHRPTRRSVVKGVRQMSAIGTKRNCLGATAFLELRADRPHRQPDDDTRP